MCWHRHNVYGGTLWCLYAESACVSASERSGARYLAHLHVPFQDHWPPSCFAHHIPHHRVPASVNLHLAGKVLRGPVRHTGHSGLTRELPAAECAVRLLLLLYSWCNIPVVAGHTLTRRHGPVRRNSSGPQAESSAWWSKAVSTHAAARCRNCA